MNRNEKAFCNHNPSEELIKDHSLPLVSILLFCKNSAKTIERSIKSVLSQEYPNIEYIVQDGASTDGTLEILKEYKSEFGSRMQLISEPDRDAAEGFHRALDRCHGTIIGSCLSDEELLPYAVTFAVIRFQEHPDAGVIHGDVYNTDLEGNILATNPSRKFDLAGYLSHKVPMHFAASFFRIDALKKAGIFNHDWADDFDFWCRLSLHAKIIHFPVVLAKYAISIKQLSERPELMTNLIANRARFINRFFQNEQVPEEVRIQKKDILINFNSWAMQTLTMKNRPDQAKKYHAELQRLKKLPVGPMNAKTSKVLLVSLPGLNTGYEPIFPLGIGYLLAAIRQDRPAQAVHYQVFDHATQQLPKIISVFQPEIVGFTCSTFNRGNVRNICAWLRKHHSHIKIVLGGVHVSFLTEQALHDYGADCVVIGEGELTFRELCNALDKSIPLSGVKGIAFRDGERIVTTEPREVVRNLDDLPMPDFSYAGDPMRRSGMGFVITSRRCPVRCRLCSTASYWGQRVRIASPRRVADEMEVLIQNYGVRKIFFYDDTFNLGTVRVGEICDEISTRRLNVEWGVSCRVHPVSQEMIDRMVAAGCRHICWGIESGSVQILTRINKKITQEQISRAYELCRKHLGTISVGAFTMVGNPGESEETIAESARFINTLPMTDPPSTAILSILPGTQLYKEVREKDPKIDRFWVENDGVPPYTLEHPLERLQQWSNVISRSGNLVGFDRNCHFWNNILFGNIRAPSIPELSFLDSELNHLIPPEIKGDEFYHLIQELARTERVSNVLEIGSSAGEGSTEAFVKGLSENPHGTPRLFCMEVSKPRYTELALRYAGKPFVHCYNTSSVPVKGFPSPEQVETFYHATKTALNDYPLERVLGWLRQDIEYVQGAGVDEDGIERIKRENDIDRFDMVLIDGSEFTGKYELDKVYGARIILLDDINGFKNYDNYQRLTDDKTYELIAENWHVRNGYAVFRRFEDLWPIHFFTLVLNGEPFIRHHIEVFRHLPFKWHWHIVEGVADLKHDTGWSLQHGGRITDELHHNGLSNDGTTEYLNEIAQQFPDNITIYRKPDGKFWDGKLEMVNAPLANIRGECLLWQVDSDELWTVDQINAMNTMFKSNSYKTSSYFYCYYFVGPTKYVSSINTWATYPNDWLRVWKYKPQMCWVSHEPPVLVNEQGVNVGLINPFTRDETMSKGITFQHFAYVTEAQVRFKEIYYGYANAVSHWERLQRTAGPVNPAIYLPWGKNDAVVDQWKKENGPLLSERYLSNQHRTKEYSSMSVDGGTVFEKELRRLFMSIRPAIIIETGTYMGQGTSSIIWRALQDFDIDGDFTTIEVNPVHHDIAKRHFQKHGMRIHTELGLTLPRNLLPNAEEIAETFVHQKQYNNIYYDHNETDRARLYFAETDHNVPDNMLYKVMEHYNFKPSFVLLDSAGHLGFAEFQYFLSLIKGDCTLMLDDIYHCKHYKTLETIKTDARFQILVESPEKFGFCIARYTHVKTLVFFRPDSIGDNIMAASMLPHIKEKYSDANICVLCQDHIAELYDSSPFVDSVIGFNRLKGYQDETYRGLILQRIQALQADLLLNSLYSRDPLYDLFAINSRARTSVAFNGNLCNIPADVRDKNNEGYTRIISGNDEPKPELERHREFLSAIGIDAPPLQPIVWITPDDEKYADTLFSDNRLDSEKTIALFVCGQWVGKFYEHYKAALSDLFKDNGMSVIVLGSSSESEINQKIIDHLDVTAINLAGKTTLRQTAAILKRCCLGIGADTGSAHIACAVGTPNVVILGGGHFGRFMPYSPLTSIVCLPLECYDCNWKCRYNRVHCIKDIKPEVLAEAVRHTLKKMSEKPRIFIQGVSFWDRKPDQPRWQPFFDTPNVADVEIIPVGDIPSLTAGIWKNLKSMDATTQSHYLREISEELIRHGEKLFSYDDFEGAELSFRRSLELQKSSPEALNNLGVLYYRIGDNERAFQNYEAAVRSQPNNATFSKNLADFYYVVRKDTEKALQIYIKGLSANPEDIEILLALGKISIENEQFQSAREFYKRVLEIDPQHKDALEIINHLNDQKEVMKPEHADSTMVEVINQSEDYLVSAIVSTYNSERFIRGCLEDLEAQTISKKLEIIVIDSASQQNERAIVEEFQKRHENIVYVLTQDREPLYAAWNRGIKMARGVYVTNTNTDDRRLPYALEAEARALEKFPNVGLVYADIWGTKIENDILSPDDTDRFRLYTYPDFSLLNGLTGSNFSPQPMWRRSVHDTVGFFDQSYTVAGDYEFFFRVAREFNALHIRTPLGLYLENPSGIEKSQPALTVREFRRLRHKFYSEIGLEEFFPLLSDYDHDREARGAALFELGNNCLIASMSPEYDLAINNYIKAKEFLGDLPQLMHNMAIAHIGTGDTKSGMKLLKKAAAKFQPSRETLRALERNGANIRQISANANRLFFSNHPVTLPARQGMGTELEEIFDQSTDTVSDAIRNRTGCWKCEESSAVDLKRGFTSIIVIPSADRTHLFECAKALKDHIMEPFEVIFIEHLKRNDKPSLKKRLSTIVAATWPESTTDDGYMKRINSAVSAATGEYIVLLEDDVVVTEGWLSGMLEHLNRHGEIGIVGPMIPNIEGRQGFQTEFNTSKGIAEFTKDCRDRYRYRGVWSRNLSGLCMLFRKELFQQTGGFDESLERNMSYEDFCLIVELEGYRNLIAGDVFVHHHGADSHAAGPNGHDTFIAGNRKRFDEKWSGIDVSSSTGKKLIVLHAIEKATQFSHKQQLQKAVETLTDAIKYAPEDKAIYYRLAEILLDAKLFSEALKALQSLPEGTEEEARRLELIGYSNEGLNQDDEAGVYADRVLSLQNASAAALNLKGVLAYKQGDRASAEDFFKKSMAADPSYGEAYTNLGVLAWSTGRKDEAFELLERGFVLLPTSSDIITLYHKAITETGQYERVEPFFLRAKSLYPCNQRIAFLLVDILIQQGKYPEAMQEIQEAMLTFGIEDGILAAALEIRSKIGTTEISRRSGRKATLSLAMIVKNEEEHIAKCLMSAKPIVDEMIVVDTGSNDRTKDIATVFGARVFDYTWNKDFAEARNYSLSLATGNWILVLDADEVISPIDYGFLRQLINKHYSRPVAYDITTRNYTMRLNVDGWNANEGKYHKEEAGNGWYPSAKVRLFMNDHRIRFSSPIHECVEPSILAARIEIKPCPLTVHHYGRLGAVEKIQKKREAYYLLGRRKLEENSDDQKAIYELAIAAGELEKFEEAIELWQRFIQLEPKVPSVFTNMGSAYVRLGRYHDALNSTKKAFELNPGLKEAVLNYASCVIWIDDAGEAIPLLEDLLRKVPDYIQAICALTAAYCVCGDRAKALELLASLRKKGVDATTYLIDQAKILYSLKRNGHARALLEAALQMRDDVEVRRLLDEYTS